MTLWRWAALAGFGVIVIALAFGRIDGMHACGAGGDPILAFEFVTSPAEVARLFPEPCRAVHAAAQHKGLVLDALGFIPVYSAFLILSLLALRHTAGSAERRLAGLGIAMTVIAALCDQFEGVQLLHLLATLPGDQGTIDLLMPAVRSKFALLALALIVAGWLLVRARGWHILPGVAIFGLALLSLSGLAGNHAMVMQGSVLGWFALIAVALIKSVKRPA
jgi:hypothetical protein